MGSIFAKEKQAVMHYPKRRKLMKRQEFDTLIFDLDGTLFDTEKNIVNSFNHALVKNGFKKRPYSEVQQLIGTPLQDMFKLYVPAEKIDACISKHRERQIRMLFKESSIFPGVKSTLKKLKAMGKNLSVATTKPEFFARKMLYRHSLTGLFDLIHGSSIKKGVGETPKDQILTGALKRIKYQKAVYIGDTLYDIKAAKNNDLPVIAVDYGIGRKKDLKDAKPDWLISDFRKLLDIIQ
ncbi:HAD hydrolase-like protein [Candidatus Woesearchaeota archaeon]|nr:HAD hydrolase-like protein [Candidatus Woesearchaeota archaeon]